MNARPAPARHPKHRFKFCAECGGGLVESQPESEDRPRLVCQTCGYIHYINPKVVVATIPTFEDRIVLLRRGIEPRRGAWTFPAGFMEYGESAEEAAIRETKEETNLDVELEGILGVFSRNEIGLVNIVYRARVVRGETALNREATEIRFVTPEEIPWEELAFPSTGWALKEWMKERGWE